MSAANQLIQVASKELTISIRVDVTHWPHVLYALYLAHDSPGRFKSYATCFICEESNWSRDKFLNELVLAGCRNLAGIFRRIFKGVNVDATYTINWKFESYKL